MGWWSSTGKFFTLQLMSVVSCSRMLFNWTVYWLTAWIKLLSVKLTFHPTTVMYKLRVVLWENPAQMCFHWNEFVGCCSASVGVEVAVPGREDWWPSDGASVQLFHLHWTQTTIYCLLSNLMKNISKTLSTHSLEFMNRLTKGTNSPTCIFKSIPGICPVLAFGVFVFTHTPASYLSVHVLPVPEFSMAHRPQTCTFGNSTLSLGVGVCVSGSLPPCDPWMDLRTYPGRTPPFAKWLLEIYRRLPETLHGKANKDEWILIYSN